MENGPNGDVGLIGSGQSGQQGDQAQMQLGRPLAQGLTRVPAALSQPYPGTKPPPRLDAPSSQGSLCRLGDTLDASQHLLPKP